jgi:hypothetical protein
MGEVIEFINVSAADARRDCASHLAWMQEKGTYKGANKDLWGMVCSFLSLARYFR